MNHSLTSCKGYVVRKVGIEVLGQLKKIENFRNLTLTIIDVIDIIGCYQGYRFPQSVSRGDQNSPRSSVQSATARAGLVEASESGAVAG